MAAVRRAWARYNCRCGLLLAGGAIISFAVFFLLGWHEDTANASRFDHEAAGRTLVLRAEIARRAALLDGLATAAGSAGRALSGSLIETMAPDSTLLWASLAGAGDAPPAWNRVVRHAGPRGPRFDSAPPWFADAIRRVARAGHSLTVPAAAPDGAELLIFAAPVRDASGRAQAVVLLAARAADAVESALSQVVPDGITLTVEDALLGGRLLYRHPSRLPQPSGAPLVRSRAARLRFADREWTVRATATPGFGGNGSVSRWALLAAGLAISALAAARARAARRIASQYAAVAETQHRLDIVQEAISMGVWDWDIQHNRTTASPETFRIFGIPETNGFPGEKEWLSLVHPDDRERIQYHLSRSLARDQRYEAEYRIVRPCGATRWLLTKGRIFRDAAGNPSRILGINIDITDLRAAEFALNENQERMRRLFAHASIGVVLAGVDGKILEVNDFFCRMTGYSREQLLAMRLRELIPPEGRESHNRRLHDLLTGAVPDYVAEFQIVRSDGTPAWIRVSCSPTVEDGRPSGMVSLCEDITARKRAEATLEFHTMFDALTGLPNRRLFNDRLEHAIAESRRAGETLAVICVDIDGFHIVNEALGPSAADPVLAELARRLRGSLRASDTLARIAGDEFAIVAPHLHEAGDAEPVGRKLIEAIGAPLRAGSHEFSLTASAGIALFPRHGGSSAELVQQAHTALHFARREGRNRFRFYTPELGRAHRERVEMEAQLRGAAARGEILVHYQPEYSLHDGHLEGFEALARWKHPELGLVPPSRFIPVAEETGLIDCIGMSVLEQACREALTWQKPGWPPLQVAVNVSCTQFFREDFVDRVLGVLEETGLDPHLLQLELTESVLLGGFSGPAAKMARLRQQGITLAVDDFGTGYSSLSYLPRLPFQCMKIDRSFVRNLHELAEPRAMIESLVTLAHQLGLKVVVEGVESPAELTAVRALGCDTVQGFLLGRPSPDTARHLNGDRRLLLPADQPLVVPPA